MRNIWAILLRELKSYFVSPIAYVFTVVFLVVSGFFFYSILQWFNFQCMQFMQYPQYAKELNINEMVMRPLFHNMSVVFLMVIPFLTMRLFSEERRSGTDELLLTSPVTMNQIIQLPFPVVRTRSILPNRVRPVFASFHGLHGVF